MSDKELSPSTEVEPQEQSFTEQLQIALKNFTDPVWLGQNSPLAAPYFLGQYLSHQRDIKIDNPKKRGEALREALRHAATKLAMEQGDEGKRLQELINASFFQPKFKTAEDIALDLGYTRPTYFRHRRQAILQLGATFLRLLKPTLRLERPPVPPQLVGRDKQIRACSEALQQGQTVGVIGLGGIGKTALGAYLARQVAPQSTFWFTVRPSLNDQLSSFYFALGYFFHSRGSSALWGQLAADKERLKPIKALSLIQYDLKHINGGVPLLCFDEVDLLRPAELVAHAQLLAFLESLRGEVPLLLIGQHLLIEPDVWQRLTDLSRSDIELMLSQAGVEVGPESLTQLHTHTRGNPRLLELFIALFRSGESPTGVLAEQSGVPPIDFLLSRIWQRLEINQEVDLLTVLTALTVFKRPAPSDVWDQAALTKLIERHLVQADDQGGVMLLPAFREGFYELLPPDNRQLLHLQAAAIRADRGEITAAARHYLKADQPQLAIWLWHKYQLQEINQGQTETALKLFQNVPLKSLERKDQEALEVLRTNLAKLIGEYDLAHRDLAHAFWDSPVLKAQAKRLEGDIADLNSRFTQAIKAYQAGLETVEHLLAEKALFHKNLGWVLMREKELDQAWHQAQLAQYEAEHLLGYIAEERGNYSEAEAYYRSALTLAKSMDHARGEAKAADDLAGLLGRKGKFAETEPLWQRARELFEHIGEIAKSAGVKVNQAAFGYNLAGQYDLAIVQATEALAKFEDLDESYGQAAASQALAEAHLGLGNLAESEQWAWRVIQAEDTSILPDGLRVLGEIKLLHQQVAEAEQLISQSIQLAQQSEDPYLEAWGWRALGRVRVAQLRQMEARKAFQQALDLFEKLNLPFEVDKTRRQAGDTLLSDKDA